MNDNTYLCFLLSSILDSCQVFLWYFLNTKIEKQIVVESWFIFQINDTGTQCPGNIDGITLFQILTS